MIFDEEYENGYILIFKFLKKLQDSGVNINFGVYGQLQGFGVYWEFWMLEQGGMSNYQALWCVIMNGVKYLGMDYQIGLLEVGKLVDLIVLDENFLENIWNFEFVCYIMVNGWFYDVVMMNEIGNYDWKCKLFYFELEGSGNVWLIMMDINLFMFIQCVCQ